MGWNILMEPDSAAPQVKWTVEREQTLTQLLRWFRSPSCSFSLRSFRLSSSCFALCAFAYAIQLLRPLCLLSRPQSQLRLLVVVDCHRAQSVSRLVQDSVFDQSSKMADEGVLAKQRLYQSVHKLTHLKGPGDKFTSVVIPFTLVGLGALMMGRGLNHLYHSTGKKEGF